MGIKREYQSINFQKNSIFCNCILKNFFSSNKSKLTINRVFFTEYLNFFLKETIYILFPKIFYKKVIEIQKYILGISGLGVTKNFYKALISILDCFHIIFKNFFFQKHFLDQKFNKFYPKHHVFRSFYVNLLRSQIVRKICLSQSISLINLNTFKKILHF